VKRLASLRDLAAEVSVGTVALTRSSVRSDDELIELLTTVRGISPWTAQMYLLFQLRRLDVWPVGDPGVRQGYALIRGLPNVPEPKQLEELGEGFRPHRSIVARYCWADLAEQRTQLLPTPRERKDDTSNPTPPRHQPLLQDQRATGSGRRGRTVHRQRNRRRAPKTMEGPRRRGRCAPWQALLARKEGR
jgi:hypothetical protein